MFNPTRAEILELVRAAVQAPSADNRHRIRFRVDADGIEVWSIDDDATGSRHQKTLHLLSVGAVVENLRLALTRSGWTFTPRWFPRPSMPRCVLDLRWNSLVGSPSVDPLADRLFTRHTNRRFFKGPPVTAVERQALEAAIEPVAGTKLHWIDEGTPSRALLRLMQRAEAARFRIPRLHAELFASIDFDAGWSRSVEERLAPSTLEVEPPLRVPFAALRHPAVMQAACRLGAHHLLGMRAATIPAAVAPHRIVVSSDGRDDDGILQGGVALERFWLTADQLDLEIQPMVAAAILADLDGGDEREEKLAGALRQGWRDLIGDRRALVVLRLGHARQPRMVSRRRPASSYLLAADHIRSS